MILIIGSGAAGISAVETIRSMDATAKITLITKDRPIYSPCLLPYYLCGEIDEKRLFFREPDFYEKMRVNTIFEKVERVVPDRNSVLLSDGREIEYDKLLIATGSSPVIHDIKGMNMRGVFYLRTIGDANEILKWCKTAKKAVVIGAGFIGVEVAVSLSKNGINVFLVEMEDRVLPGMLDADMAEIAREQLEKNGIKVLLESRVTEIMGSERIYGVAINGEITECDFAIVSAGVRPNTDLLRGTAVKVDSGIIVDGRMRTSVENIYAAGDVAESIDSITEKRRINAIWTNAVKQGRTAGFNIAGIKREYDGSDNMNTITIFDLPFVSMGYKSPEIEGCEELTANDKKVFLKNNRIIGFQSVGYTKNTGVILSLMRKRSDVSRIREVILEDDFGYGKVHHSLSSFINFTILVAN